MERCPSCQQEVAPGLEACKFCHTPMLKLCPFCKEKIRTAAIKCKFCHADLAANAAPQPAKSPELAKLENDALIALILGLVPFAGFWITAPFAWYMGAKTNRKLVEIGQPKNTMATFGHVLGIVFSVLIMLVILMVAGMIVLAIVAALSAR